MRRLRIAALAVLVSLPFASRAAAPPKYPWNLPSNVRIVQASPVDNVLTFSTVAAALGSITNPSASSPYVVKVMPGVYTEPLLTVPAFVKLEGSGIESTIINGEFQVYGTVSNLKANAYFVMYDNSVLDRVQVYCNYYYRALTAYGANVTIVDSIVEGTNNGVGVSWGDLTLKRSTVIAADLALYLDFPANVVDSEIRANSTAIRAQGGYALLNVRGGKVAGTTLVTFDQFATAQLNFGGTQLAADYSGLRSGVDKAVNCYNAAFSPIPNL